MQKRTKAGLTFVELLIVVGCVMLVGGILLAALSESSRNARQQSVKHLYVLSAYNGEVIIHSAVRGDVETLGRKMGATREPGYLRWRDTNGASHELYVSDRTVIHISSEPLALKGNNPGAETASRLEADK